MWTRRANSFGGFLLAACLSAAPAPDALAQSPVRDGSGRPVDALIYRIAVDVGPDAAAYRASAEITFRITIDGTERVGFDFVGLTVDSVTADGAPAGHELTGERLLVELGRSAEAGDTVVVRVVYGGAPEDGLVFRNNRYGRPTVFADNWPNRARYWFPGVDHPSDKATVEFRVRAPREWRVVAVGELREVIDTEDGTKLWVWATDRPIPVYTMVLGAGELVERELGTSGCDVETSPCVSIAQWTYAEDEEQLLQLFRRAPEIVAFFDSLIGPFPYEKLALVQSSTRFGGMENSSAIFLTERVGRLDSADGLLAHEIAHQWFGDAITEREWPHVWLSEGFATYFTSVFFELVDGADVGAASRARSEGSYLRSDAVARPLIDAEPENLFRVLSANSYQKGAWVLHMLRSTLGDEAFFAGIRLYYADHRHGTALTADLQKSMEEASGEDLGWFFEQWLYRPGYPEVEVAHVWDPGEKVLRIHVRQIQYWGAFRIPLDLQAEGDGYSLRRTLEVQERESSFEWELPSAPQRVEADPENEILGPVHVVR
ncbi:MAG: M1 family aminopeptidase [Gemmatimonadales bacterium]|jgi:aminopeptidase N